MFAKKVCKRERKQSTLLKFGLDKLDYENQVNFFGVNDLKKMDSAYPPNIFRILGEISKN